MHGKILIKQLLGGKKLDYKIVYAESDLEKLARNQLEDKVKELIAKGWKVQGGISLSRSDTINFRKISFAQAMIKEG